MRDLSESERKVKKVVQLKDEKEFEERYSEFVETPIQDTGDFHLKTRVGGGRIFVGPNGEEILPEHRNVKCRCGRKLRIWLCSLQPPVWIGCCPCCLRIHCVGDTEAMKQ